MPRGFLTLADEGAPRPSVRFAGGWSEASAPPDMGRAQLGCAVYEIGEKGEILLDVAFVPAAIDQEHGPGFLRLLRGMAGEAWPRRLRRATTRRALKQESGRACGVNVFDPERVQDAG